MAGLAGPYNAAMPSHDPKPRGFFPTSRLASRVSVPPSKSMAQRALLFASLTHGQTRLVGLDREAPCADVAAAHSVSRALGAESKWVAPRALTLTGRAPGHHGRLVTSGTFEVGESGTLARLATATAALLCQGEIEVRGTGSLLGRSSPALFEGLMMAGARFRRSAGVLPAGWPVRVRGIGPPADLYLRGATSSQAVSAMLMVAGAYPDAIQVHVEGPIPSRPYVTLTTELLARFGVQAIGIEPRCRDRNDDGESFEVRGVLTPPEAPLIIEPDASAAAVALCAGAIVGRELQVAGDFRDSVQADLGILECLRAFGLECGTEPGWLWVRGSIKEGARLDLSGMPDLAPPLVAVAAVAAARSGARSYFSGLGTLRGKESDRYAGLSAALERLGLEVVTDPDGITLEVGPGDGRAEADLCLDPSGDHRMAFTFALLGLGLEGVTVSDPSVVAKSWPAFRNALLTN